MNDGITDPSDWPAEFNSLREIESHLRCPICKEILRAPLILQCSHNFCSVCIRRHLDKELACPACRKEASILQLRRNTTLDEIANYFKDCRSSLLKTVRDSLTPKTSKPQLARGESMDIDEFTPNQKRRRTSTRITNKPMSRPNSQDTVDANMDSDLVEDSELDDKDDDFFMPSQEAVQKHKGKSVSRGAKGPILRSRGGGRTSDTNGVAASNLSSQSQQPPTTQLTTSTTTTTATTTATTKTAATTATSTPNNAPSTQANPTTRSLVPCPICEMAIPESYTNTHLDNFCLHNIPDPAYTIPYKLLAAADDQRVIEIYEKQGTSNQNVLGALPTSEPASRSSSNSNSPASPRKNNGAGIFNPTNGQNSKSGSPLQNRTKFLSISSLGKPPPLTYPEPKRIPKLTYSVLNDKQLRKKLQEHGLNTHGDKQLMQKRHAEYVTIFNANCDATRPQTNAQLMKSMEIWERSYEQDMQAKRKQQQELVKRQEQVREAAAANSSSTDPTSPFTNGPSSQPSSSQGSSSSSSFIPNQNNNTEKAASVAAASAFAHVLKYADEYAELIADVKKRMKADKEKLALAEKQKSDQESK
ncbi:E3 ubiquitin-protein ligase rad18 [Entomortierella beljakovae]|nr:E3 ubiquitin-protein ligase rad18 [Entomortierella beljakovae]